MIIALARASLIVPLIATCACGVAINGNFDGVPFTPDASIAVVADRHDMLQRGDAVIAVKRALEAQRVHVLLTAGRVDIAADWRRYPADSLLDLKRELATSDGLLLKNLRLDALQELETQIATIDGGIAAGDFEVAVAPALPDASVVAEQGFGAKVTVTVVPRSLDAKVRGGSIALDVEVKRE